MQKIAAFLSVAVLFGCAAPAPYMVWTKDDNSQIEQDEAICDFEAEKARASAGHALNGFIAGYEKAEAHKTVYAACMRSKGYTKVRYQPPAQ